MQYDEEQQRTKRILIVVVCILIAIIILLLILLLSSTSASNQTGFFGHDEVEGNGKTEQEGHEDGSAEDDSSDVEQEVTTLVCVPAEYMSLRKKPGLGDDVISQLYAGTRLEWYGETETVSDTDFYKVKVIDTEEEGYVAASFCVEEMYPYQENELSIVEVNDSLYTYDMMAEDVKELCNKYPDFLSYEVLGRSRDGREIYEVTVGNPDAVNHVMVQAGIHGREYMTSQLAMRLIEYYACYCERGNYDDISYQELFDRTAIHVIPMSNPDGISISQLGLSGIRDENLMQSIYDCYERDKWYLTLEVNSTGDTEWADHYKESGFDLVAAGYTEVIPFEEYLKIWKANAAGIDLNNNFDANWSDIDLKQEPSFQSFKGYEPVSEPETQALERLALERDYRYFISYHSRGQIIYYDTDGNQQSTTEASENLATLMENSLKYPKVSTKKGYNVNQGVRQFGA